MPDGYKLATVILDGCVYEVWQDREPTGKDLERLSHCLSHRNAGDPLVFGPPVRVVMTHSAVTPEVVEKLRAALEQRHAGPDPARPWVSMRDWKFGERAEAALRQLAKADADLAAGVDYHLPPDEPDAPHVVTT